MVGNWAPGLQTEVKKGEKVEVVRRCGRPKDKRETLDKDTSFCDRLISEKASVERQKRKSLKTGLGCV